MGAWWDKKSEKEKEEFIKEQLAWVKCIAYRITKETDKPKKKDERDDHGLDMEGAADGIEEWVEIPDGGDRKVRKTKSVVDGLEGLWDACNRYDPDEAISQESEDKKFRGYARKRVEGAIKDGLSRLTGKKDRTITRKGKTKTISYSYLTKVKERLKQKFQREPTEDEITEEIVREKFPEFEGKDRRYLEEKVKEVIEELDLEIISYKEEMHDKGRDISTTPPDDPETEMIKNEERVMLMECLEKIREEYGDVLKRHYWDEKKIKEIAELLGKNENVIKTWMKRGKEKLKECIEKRELKGGR